MCSVTFQFCPFLGKERQEASVIICGFPFEPKHVLKNTKFEKYTSYSSHKLGLSGVALNSFWCFGINLSSIFPRDIRKFKDAKKQFEKVSEEKENALVKNAQVQRNKQHEVEEATNILTATRKCFRHIALDYVLQVRTAIKVTFQNHLLHMVRDVSFTMLEVVFVSFLEAVEIQGKRKNFISK